MSNEWIQKADFDGIARRQAVGFSIGNKGYIGTGTTTTYSGDFWEYNPSTDEWNQKANLGGVTRDEAIGFSIGDYGYIGSGFRAYAGDNGLLNDFWKYDPSTNQWTQTGSLGSGTYGAKASATGFSVGGKGYIVAGRWGDYRLKNVQEYDPSTGQWTTVASFGGGYSYASAGFAIGEKGYIGTGIYAPAQTGGSPTDFFWEYDPSENSWSQKADFGGGARYGAVGFAIGEKGYIGFGHDGVSYLKDLWEYDPSTDEWTQVANYGGVAHYENAGFAIGELGYVGTGYDGSSNMTAFWEYTPPVAAAAVKPGRPLRHPTGASVSGGIECGMGKRRR